MCSGRDRVPVGQRGQFAIVPPMGRTQLASEHTDSNQRVIIAMLASIDAGEFTAATDHFTDDITIILGNSEPLVGVLAFIRRSKEFTGSFQSGAGGSLTTAAAVSGVRAFDGARRPGLQMATSASARPRSARDAGRRRRRLLSVPPIENAVGCNDSRAERVTRPARCATTADRINDGDSRRLRWGARLTMISIRPMIGA
jgi:hypothetical protein